ncbi:MAG: TaqI-like C-terminal specificity domain-containing protein [Euryarchaeota archaeon]|nr:TaqI-like C-terminal specificity domain-containing protein [Euryarchaeota archaeon]
MDTAKKIRASLKKLYGKIKSAKEISEEDLRVAFVKSGILEVLGYEGELKDVRFEKNVKGKRSDLLAFDDYQNVVFVVEFKRPNEIDVERDFAQLWERYVKPLKARYGLLTDGLELLLYERINSNWERKLRVNLGEVTLSQCEEVYDWLKKPSIERTRIEAVLGYFERFDNPEEKVNLSSEIAQKHFFDGFELKEGSVFVNLVQKTIGLFDFELERSKFLKSAYNFWKISYAKKPEKVPENWQRIMDRIGLEANEENLFKFMFCLESAYSLFTRLILAKACEDYKLPYVDFCDFIKREIRRIAWSQRGDISSLAWPITTKNLIESMKQKLVKSVFEGDIFYWWEDSFKELGYLGLELKPDGVLYSPYHTYEKQKAYFGDALAEVILTLYKFDFSEIVGDPLGTLYQRYFDKETRKALGEFYTPKEVVEYILDAVGYDGRGVIGKRLLDPACGSGTFLVEALRRYLKASEEIVEEKGWSGILKELCNEYCIAGFDIHPFATFMAQMQFMLVLIPAYKKAIEEEDPKFVLNRLPIFRTDSLVDETKGEAMKVTIETFESGRRYILIDTCLPVEGGNLKIKMPYDKDVFSRTDLLNVQEYFAALQAVFDTVKESARQEKYEVDKEELERDFKRYLEDKEWSGLVSFFTPYAEHFLQKFNELKETFGDGKLIKSIEDIMLAAILKNYVKYDYVVGNPPYVRKEKLGDKSHFEANFPEIYHGDNDLCVYFLFRGMSWLSEGGKFGYIVSGKFTKTRYGKYIRAWIPKNYHINQVIDLRGSKVFSGVAVDPIILITEKTLKKDDLINIAEVKNDPEIEDWQEKLETLLKLIQEHTGKVSPNEYLLTFNVEQERLVNDIQTEKGTDKHWMESWKITSLDVSEVFKKIKSQSSYELKKICDIGAGIETGWNGAFVFDNHNVAIAREVESELLKPLLKGEDVGRWISSYKNRVIIYTHPLDEDSLDKYPKAKEHLLKYKEDLEKRKKILCMGKKWYQICKPISKRFFESKKILIPDISQTGGFALDNVGFYCIHTIYIVTPKDEYKSKLNFLLGLLNSSVVDFYFKQVGSYLGKKGYRYQKQYLDTIPICLPQTKSEQDLADEITNKVEQILEQVKLQQQIENFPYEYIQEYRSKGEEFDTKSISFNSNHKALEPLVEETVDSRGYNIVIGKKEKLLYAESKVKAHYIVTVLKGKRAKKDEKKQILIPKSDAIVEEILKKLEEDKAKIKFPSVAELEEEINELVYKLYGLNEKDVKVIEDFLRRV